MYWTLCLCQNRFSYRAASDIRGLLPSLVKMPSVLSQRKYLRTFKEIIWSVGDIYLTENHVSFWIFGLYGVENAIYMVGNDIVLNSRNDCRNFRSFWYIVSSLVLFCRTFVCINEHMLWNRVRITKDPLTQITECINIWIDVLYHFSEVFQEWKVELWVVP